MARRRRRRRLSPEERKKKVMESWVPRTRLGKKVKNGEITSIDEIIDSGQPINEPEIVDLLLSRLDQDLILLGQRKGKFGGGKRSRYRVTQKKTEDGTTLSFSTLSVIGDHDGHVGMGFGKAKETVPSREKATAMAKKNIIKIVRGCGSWECGCGEPHTLPFEITGKCGSVRVTLKPAPKGIGLNTSEEVKKVLKLAGIKDVWGTVRGQSSTRLNLMKAVFDALKKLAHVKIPENYVKKAGITRGSAE